jgi:TATA-binding protein-associated factor Taf7
MTEQSPQPSHELARDTDAQPSEHEPAIAANETFPLVGNKVPDDVAHEKDAESGDATGKEGGTEARDVKNEESNDKKSGHDEDNEEEEEEEEDDDDDEADDDDDDDEDDEEDDDEDEEPRLKYARLTQHLNGVYRNGDATSAFLVAGDKMVGYVCVGACQLANVYPDSWNA